MDGAVTGFGRRFWDCLAKAAPLVVGAMRTPGVVRIVYTDRYLLQAHGLRLLSEVLRQAPGIRGAACHVRLAFDERPPAEPRFVHHNFPADAQRADVLRLLLPEGADVTLYRKTDLPHCRSLSAELADGRRVEILLDQGLGAWRAVGALPHDFAAPATGQARALSAVTFDVRAETPTPPISVQLK